MLNLFINSLIPPAFGIASQTVDLHPIPLQSPANVIERGDQRTESGFFSSLSSYVSSFANDEPPEPSDQEIEYTLCTVDTINECALEDIVTNIR